MRYGIYSDIHGNLEALQAVLKTLRGENVDGYFCGGDVVGYGANPNECVETVKSIASVCIAGNHDWAVINKIKTTFFNPVAYAAIRWTIKNSSAETLSFLKGLKLIYRHDDFLLVHGTLYDAQDFHYLVTETQADTMFSLMDRDVCFVGHSHDAGVFEKDGNRIVYSAPQEIKLHKNRRYIVNVGSIGQPRDGDSRSCCCIFDTDEKLIQFKRVDYDIKEAQRKILEAGLPGFLSSRLALGK